jgi:hypothetical protein
VTNRMGKETRKMEWLYKIVSFNVTGGHVREEELVVLLNEAGEAGWELMSVTSVVSEGHTTCLVHHMRKPQEPKRRAGFAP